MKYQMKYYLNQELHYKMEVKKIKPEDQKLENQKLENPKLENPKREPRKDVINKYLEIIIFIIFIMDTNDKANEEKILGQIQLNEANIAEQEHLNEAKIAEEDQLNEEGIAERERESGKILNFFDQVYPNLVIVNAKNINLVGDVLSITNKNGEVVSLTLEPDALDKIDNFIKNNPSLQGNSGGGKRKIKKTKYSKKCKK